MRDYELTKEEVLSATSTDVNGLNSDEASKRLAENGKNKLKEAEKDPIWKRFLMELADPMIIILIVAATFSAITAIYAHESFADVFIILFVVIINAALGVYQQSKAEKAIEALNEMAAATSKILRDGKTVHIKSEDIVVGDVVVLEAGDAIPADGRIITCASMTIEEAALTGESVPVNKTADVIANSEGKEVPLGDRKNMVYMGSTVVYGRGEAVITQIGMDTEMGKIATAIAEAKDGQTPLQIKLGQLSKTLTMIVLAVCAFMFVFSMLRAGSFSGQVLLNTFMISVSLAVAAIPEGLAAVVTIVLSIGVTNMSKRNAVIRKLTAVETLGCAQIICSDKTGTLTQNKMTVVDHFSDDEKLLGGGMALCSDAEIDKDGKVIGEPTEAALVAYAYMLSLPKNELKEKQPRLAEAPFDSMRKMMSTIHNVDGKIVQYTKGAPDEVLRMSTMVLQNGEIIPLTDILREKILSENKRMADKALRVLALATKEYGTLPEDTSASAIESDLVFVGLTGMIDPIRPEVLGAINKCRDAGIRAVMITGDHKDTAVAIASQLGILDENTNAITGADLNSISDEEFEKTVQNYSVYARVQPEHKVRIVNAWQKLGKISAMTGDGVNDAPSIKTADIGIGMGITGTDVTKNVADMVLADDNFATIVSAVEEGRKVYDNIRKAIQFLLSSNLSEVLSIFIATIGGFVILKPAHLLWINLVTDCFPALALGMEEAEEDIMTRSPREPNEGIFSGGVAFDIFYQGVMTAVITLAAYFIGHYIESGVWEIASSKDGMTMAFLTMSMAEIFHSFNMRSQRKSIFKMKKQNMYLLLAMVASFVMTTLVIYVPFLANAFEFEAISLLEYSIAIGLALLVVPTIEIVKFIQRKLQK